MNNPGENMDVFSHVQGRHGRGPSSFWMHDPEVVFSEIELKRGDSFLDLGCGPGDYAIYAAGVVGSNGAVYAIDKCAEMVNDLIKKADSRGIENIFGIISDITAPLQVSDNCIDICFISTVLHTPGVKGAMNPLLDEIQRVLKPGGRLVIIECKKQDALFGPPVQARLSPEEIEALTKPGGFEKAGFTDLGYNYMIQFRPAI